MGKFAAQSLNGGLYNFETSPGLSYIAVRNCLATRAGGAVTAMTLPLGATREILTLGSKDDTVENIGVMVV